MSVRSHWMSAKGMRTSPCAQNLIELHGQWVPERLYITQDRIRSRLALEASGDSPRRTPPTSFSNRDGNAGCHKDNAALYSV